MRKADETYRPDHVRGQSLRKTFEAIAGENVVRGECERLEFWLMFVLGRRDLFLTRLRDTKQKFWIDSASLRVNNYRARIDFAQLGFKRFDLLWVDKIDLVQKQDIG